jgi:hypothetical protein
LGTLCQSSQLLKDIGLKQESYPFDWIFSTPIQIIDIIDDDFSKFLNKELYITIDDKSCGHKIYNNNMFNHHNPKNDDNHYSYFMRCVIRFRKLLKIQSNKLFIITYCNFDSDTKVIENVKKTVMKLNIYLSKIITNYYIFVIYHIPNQLCQTSIIDIDNIKFVLIYTESVSNGLFLKDMKENNIIKDCLLNSYSFKIKKLE